MNKKLFFLFIILLSIHLPKLNAHPNPPFTDVTIIKPFILKQFNESLFYFHDYASEDNQPFFANRFVKVNLYGGTNPYNSGGWNNWNVTGTTNITSGIFNYDDGTSSGISAVLNSAAGVADNGATYGGTMCPPEVLRYASYSTSTRTVTLSGLNNSLKYNLEFFFKPC